MEVKQRCGRGNCLTRSETDVQPVSLQWTCTLGGNTRRGPCPVQMSPWWSWKGTMNLKNGSAPEKKSAFQSCDCGGQRSGVRQQRGTVGKTMISAAAVTAAFLFRVALIVPAGLASTGSAGSKHKSRVCVCLCVCGEGRECHVPSFPFHAFRTLYSGRFLYMRNSLALRKGISFEFQVTVSWSSIPFWGWWRFKDFHLSHVPLHCSEMLV